jgi:tetratricopeptide (TPR) repeat protein
MEKDPFWGTRAEAILEETDEERLRLWEDRLQLLGDGPQVMGEIGRACLYNEDPERAEKYFRKAIEQDPDKSALLLDLARYHVFNSIRGGDATEHLPLAEAFVLEYLETDPINPLQAWCYGLLGKIKRIQGNEDEGTALLERAKNLDSWYSQAFGLPAGILYSPPGETYDGYMNYFGIY